MQHLQLDSSLCEWLYVQPEIYFDAVAITFVCVTKHAASNEQCKYKSVIAPVVNDSLVEGSNIDELIDEIVERDMPQGVTEPIVFPPHVSQQPNPGAAHLQMTSNAVHKRISPSAVPVTNPGQMTVTPTSGTGTSSLPIEVVMAGSPLNSPASPGSPLATSRSSSPNAKAANLAGKVSAPIRTGNQAMRFTQPGSPLQNATQPAVKVEGLFQ